MITISELSEQRYVELDKFVSNESVINLIDAIEAIQTQLGENKIEAKEMYEYLVTIMLNQA